MQIKLLASVLLFSACVGARSASASLVTYDLNLVSAQTGLPSGSGQLTIDPALAAGGSSEAFSLYTIGNGIEAFTFTVDGISVSPLEGPNGSYLHFTTYAGGLTALQEEGFTTPGVTPTVSVDYVSVFTETGLPGSYELLQVPGGPIVPDDNGYASITLAPTSVTPEPSGFLLLSTGLIGSATMFLRRARFGDSSSLHRIRAKAGTV